MQKCLMLRNIQRESWLVTWIKKQNQHQLYRIAKQIAKEKQDITTYLKDSTRKLIVSDQRYMWNQYLAKLMKKTIGIMIHSARLKKVLQIVLGQGKWLKHFKR